MDDSQKAPTTWIAISAVLALVAIGLGIWAFTTRSDLDDTKAELDQQTKRLANAQGAATSEEERLEALNAADRRRIQRVRRRFLREKEVAKGLRGKISQEADQLSQTRNQLSSAESQEERDKANLSSAQQEVKLAKACVKGAVAALNRSFNAPTARAGALAAVAELEAIQSDCQQAD